MNKWKEEDKTETWHNLLFKSPFTSQTIFWGSTNLFMTGQLIVINKLLNWYKINPIMCLELTMPDSQLESACLFLAKGVKSHGQCQALCSANCIFPCMRVDVESLLVFWGKIQGCITSPHSPFPHPKGWGTLCPPTVAVEGVTDPRLLWDIPVMLNPLALPDLRIWLTAGVCLWVLSFQRREYRFGKHNNFLGPR